MLTADVASNAVAVADATVAHVFINTTLYIKYSISNSVELLAF